jgi:hypothetical protein
MKTVPAILAAAFLVAGTSLALAQGDTTEKPGISKRGDDTNPSVPSNSPVSGNSSAKKAMHSTKPMMSKPVSAHRTHHANKKMPERK